MAEITLTVPDIGDFTDVEIIEILVKEGDSVALEDSLITLETDKATMDIPASEAGTIKGMLVKVGDRVNEGDAIAKIDSSGSPTVESQPAEPTPAAAEPVVSEPAPAADTPIPKEPPPLSAIR